MRKYILSSPKSLIVHAMKWKIIHTRFIFNPSPLWWYKSVNFVYLCSFSNYRRHVGITEIRHGTLFHIKHRKQISTFCADLKNQFESWWRWWIGLNYLQFYELWWRAEIILKTCGIRDSKLHSIRSHLFTRHHNGKSQNPDYEIVVLLGN